jgi:hypothetical protein
MVFGTPSSNISAGSWATPGGGGGASAGAYGSLPGTCSDGTTYQTNDSAFPTPALCHPANTWSWFFGGKSIIPAGALTMATQYSNGGTIDSTHGYDSILLPASGSNSVTARSYTPASMATPYTKYFQVNLPYFGDNNNYKLWVIGVIDATGVFGGVQCGVGSGANSGFWCRNVLLSSSGGYTGSPSGLITFTGTTLFPAAFSGPFVVGINDDGTVIHFTFGPSVQVQMELTAAALTKSGNIGSPTKIAYGGTNSGAGAAFTIQFVGAY